MEAPNGQQDTNVLKPMLVGPDFYGSEIMNGEFARAWNFLGIEYGKFLKAKKSYLEGDKNRRNLQRLCAGEFSDSQVFARGYPFAGVNIIVGEKTKAGFYVFTRDSSLSIKDSGEISELELSDGTKVTVPNGYHPDYDFSQADGLRYVACKNLGIRSANKDGIFVDSMDSAAWRNYDMAQELYEKLKKEKSIAEERNLRLRRGVLGRLLLCRGVISLSNVRELPEPKRPNDILLEYGIATDPIVRMYSFLNVASLALADLDNRNI